LSRPLFHYLSSPQGTSFAEQGDVRSGNLSMQLANREAEFHILSAVSAICIGRLMAILRHIICWFDGFPATSLLAARQGKYFPCQCHG
jgi:hypothetical protein